MKHQCPDQRRITGGHQPAQESGEAQTTACWMCGHVLLTWAGDTGIEPVTSTVSTRKSLPGRWRADGRSGYKYAGR